MGKRKVARAAIVFERTAKGEALYEIIKLIQKWDKNKRCRGLEAKIGERAKAFEKEFHVSVSEVIDEALVFTS